MSATYTLSRLGSLSYAGSVYRDENNATFHEDAGYAQYYIPDKAKNYPLIFWHGLGQSGICFERTVDSKDGFMQDFLKDDWACYVIDQPRRGRAARTRSVPSKAAASPGTVNESGIINGFRLGTWNPPENAVPEKNSAFPFTPFAMAQFLHQQCPDNGDEPTTEEFYRFMGETMGDLMEMTGDSILFTHSNAGKYGWFSAIYAGSHMKALLSYEPGGQYVWPDGRFPDIYTPVKKEIDEYIAMPSVPEEDFKRLADIPIRIYFGDNIPTTPQNTYNGDKWRIALERGRAFCELINSYGGDAKVILLPELGVKGNSHAGFQETNHEAMADVIKKELKALGLDRDDHPTQGPVEKKMDGFTIPITM